MKTNQEMIRKMGDFNVVQRTKDGMFNATALLKQWNEMSESTRKMDNYFNLQGTEEFVNAIIAKENLTDRKSVYVKSRGKNGGTWMDINLFLIFLEWLSVGIQSKIIMILSNNREMSLKEAINTALSDIQLKQINKEEAKTYIMVDDESGYYKIGKSINPEFREKTLCYATPKIRTVAVHEEDIEGMIHKKYDDFRIRGEWFSLSESQVNNIITKYKFQTN